MNPCQVCQQSQERRLLIEADIGKGLTSTRIAMRYHIPKNAVDVHALVCLYSPKVSSPQNTPDEPISAACEVCSQAPRYRVQAAWRAAKDDIRERAHIVQWLNEQLESEQLGLL
jgi:hypothetical protein